jgi:hypothetical protein
MLNSEFGVGCGSSGPNCKNSGDCANPPDLCIKRHDTRPHLKIAMSDCDGPIDLSEEGLVVEASMWFDAKLKADIQSSASQIRFADDIGFESVSVGDVVSTSKSRTPEMMLVTAVDEASKTLTVSRGHSGTVSRPWNKGTELAVFRFRDEPAKIESVFEESEAIDGSVSENLAETLLVFEWAQAHTSFPGCYWLEFKILKMTPSSSSDSVDWIKRIPLSSPGFTIRIVDSPTSPS